jgi:hypothetical protein
MADPLTRGTVGRAIESRGLGSDAESRITALGPRGGPVSATGLSMGPLYRGAWAEMAFQAAMMGFTVTGRNEKAGHNPGSRHYVGEAIDVRTAGKTNAEIADFMRFMSAQGYVVRDERQRPPGQAVWGGPHIHVEAFDWERFVDAFSPLRQIR